MAFLATVLANFGLFMLLLAILAIAINRRVDNQTRLAELCFRWISLLPLGLMLLYASIMHLLFAEFTAQQIGWNNSPFQFEVAIADFALGVISILAFKARFDFRLATVIANSILLWGDAMGHLYQIYLHSNYTVGNAGSWLWMDLLVPLLLIVCLYKLAQKKKIN